MYKIFRTPAHHLGSSGEPDYILNGGKLFPTATHPRGWSEKPDYVLKSDGNRPAPEYEVRELSI
jgi:hypothetical protein